MIEASLSPLKLGHFHLLESAVSFINPEKKTSIEERKAIIAQYKFEFELDFGKRDNNTFFTYVELSFNSEAEPDTPCLPGYSVYLSAIGSFRVDDFDKLTTSEKSNLVHYSTVNYIIGRLRDHLYQVTSLSVWGAYTLPSVDMKDLLDKWFASQEKKSIKKAISGTGRKKK
jgi:hypothetical protein